MEMKGQRNLAVTQDQAWTALNDPATLKACLPGCDRFEADGENRYTVSMLVKVGPVSARFNGKIQLSDVQPPSGYRISFEGQGGAAGFGKGSSSVTLTPAGNGCELHYGVTASVGGKLAQLGQRLIDGTAKSMAEDFFRRFDDEMERRHPLAPQTASVGLMPGSSPVSPVPHERPASPPVPSWAWIAAAAACAACAVALANHLV